MHTFLLKLKKLAIVILLLICTFNIYAQNLDSLYIVYTKTTNKTEKDKIARIILNRLNVELFDSVSIDSAISLAHFYKDDTAMASISYLLALQSTLTGDFPKAIALMYKASKYFEFIQDTSSQSFCIKEIGVYYRYLKNYPEAVKNYKRAISILNLLNKEEHLLLNFNYSQGLARVYLEMKKPDLAFPLLQEVNLLYINHEDYFDNEIKLKLDCNLRLNNLFASYYIQKGDSDLAELYFKKCFATNIDSIYAFTDSYFDACLKYCQLKTATKDFSQAKKYGLIAYNHANKCNNMLFICNASEQLYKTFLANNQKDSALYYLQIFYNYNDSLKEANLKNDVLSSSILLHIDEQEQLTKEKEEKERRNHNIQFVALAIGILTLLLLFFMFSSSIIVGAKTIEVIGTIALLMVFEFINLFIHPYIGHWLHESPVLMLLALVCIAAIIVPLHHKLEHFTKEKLIAKNKKIRLENAKKTILELDKESK